MRSLLVSPFAKGFYGALAASAFLTAALISYHLYTDHLAFHALLAYVEAHAAQINALPK